ncbi:hypothetical protein V1477_011049 [Vespula maculifrons]|uniref:Uncharacterized protein n=1 Tax=Vespula maculifrons TaxID=7453 RepID=A0ABD2C487_VESMC
MCDIKIYLLEVFVDTCNKNVLRDLRCSLVEIRKTENFDTYSSEYKGELKRYQQSQLKTSDDTIHLRYFSLTNFFVKCKYMRH